MNRRRALVALAGLLPGAVLSQQGKLKRVGYFSASSANANAPRVNAFRQGMAALGWVDGKDYILDARYAEGVSTNVSQLAADVVAGRPDVILAPGDVAIRALVKITRTLPIVFATSDDPLALEVVKSLQRPGGNATGLTTLRGPLSAKNVQLLKEAFPHVTHVALVYSSSDRSSAEQARAMSAVAARLDMRATSIEIRTAEEIPGAISGGKAAGCHAYAIADGYLFTAQRKKLVEAVFAAGLPAIFTRTEYAEAGGLISYASSTVENFRRAATYVDKILKGANPGELAIEQPSRFELTLNMKTAKATGIAIPTSLLVRADRVIQ